MRVLGLLPATAAGLVVFLPTTSSVMSGFVSPTIDRIVQRTTSSLRRKHDAVSSSSSSSLQASLVLSPSILSVGSVAASSSSSDVSVQKEQLSREQERDALIHQQGGLFTVRTKYGALNPYAVYYGTVSILLGLPWFLALTAYQLFALVTRNKLDTNRTIPVYMNQVWGTLLLRLTRSYPNMENRQVLVDFYKEYVQRIHFYSCYDFCLCFYFWLKLTFFLIRHDVLVLLFCFVFFTAENVRPCLWPIIALGWTFPSWAWSLVGAITK